jgi:hypothetical protein
MAKKLSRIRFKPKLKYYDTFLNDVIENGKDSDPTNRHTIPLSGDLVE